MQNMIDNYVNGNLTDAKQQAKRHKLSAIRAKLLELGHNEAAAFAIAAFLKGEGTFQAACDAEYAEKAAR